MKQSELEKEKNDILIGAFEEEKILGCCLLTKVDKDCVRLRQMAVQNNLQGKGIGASMMHFAENVAGMQGIKNLLCMPVKLQLAFMKNLAIKFPEMNSLKFLFLIF